MTQPVSKMCMKCARDVSHEKRVKDAQGRYYCAACYEKARQPVPTVEQGIDHEIELALAPVREAPPNAPAHQTAAAPMAPALAATTGSGSLCPCCQKSLGRAEKICVACGIQVPSGRPVITSLGRDLNTLHANAETIIRWLSWVMRLGLYPIASEAYATRKPVVTWVIAILTTITSIAFFVAMQADPPSKSVTQLMLWPPAQPLSDARILAIYHDHQDDVLGQAMRAMAKEEGDPGADKDPVADKDFDAHLVQGFRDAGLDEPDGSFRWYQLLTNVFLHDPGSVIALILHLGGNMLFLLIFGTRVNALIGNFKMAILYPLLGILASAAHLMFTHDAIGRPALGASGAIMGLAGMYLIFFPVHKVYMAFWFKLWWRIPTWIKIWPVRGFWVLAFYLAFDVVGTLLTSGDGVAHWAHLGGFVAGAVIAILLLVTRQQDARHADLLSVLLGKQAWPFIGRPTPMVRAVVIGDMHN